MLHWIDPGGIWITMALGVAGSLLATLIGKGIGWYGQGEAAGFFMSLIGAIVLLLIYRLYKSKTGGSSTT